VAALKAHTSFLYGKENYRHRKTRGNYGSLDAGEFSSFAA
jgi:hypothetical protein